MKMKNYSLLLGFIFVFSGFVLDNGVCAENKLSGMEKQEANVFSRQLQFQKKTIKAKEGQAKNKLKATTVKQKSTADKEQELALESKQKPLDLSLPFQVIEGAKSKNLQKQAALEKAPNLFIDKNEKARFPLKFDGGVLMSQELESEKQRSFDGAGIRINLIP
jgi:hypothetical protein